MWSLREYDASKNIATWQALFPGHNSDKSAQSDDDFWTSKDTKGTKRDGDALRAEPTNGPTHEREENHARMSYPERKGGRWNQACAEPNSFELCHARRRKTKSNLSKIFQKSMLMPRASWNFRVFRVFRCSLIISCFLNIERHERNERDGDALRAEPTNKAGAEPNSFELCPARRRKTKSNLSKIYADAKGIMKKFVSFVFFDVPWLFDVFLNI